MSEINRTRTETGSSRRPTATSGRQGSSRATASQGARQGAGRTQTSQGARSAGSRGRNTARSTGAGTAARRRRRRRQRPDVARILLLLIGLVILILCVAIGVKGCSKDADSKDAESNVEETTTEPETELEAEITINGKSVHGMTKSEAREMLLGSLGWDVKVSFNGEEKQVGNLLESRVEEVLDQAFSGSGTGSYAIRTDGLEDAAKEQAEALAQGWDVKPKNGSIDSFDSATQKFTFSKAEKGIVINREELAADILAALASENYKAVIAASANEVEPEITEEQARANFQRIGTYTTTTTANKARNENIRIASEALNGIIIQPGQEFSFNLTTGNRTTEKGYQAAGAYVNGVLVEEPGGGVCQVSSTLYNAVVFSGLKTTERHAHSYEPSYVTPGEDAMVSYDGFSGPDMKFVNNSKTAVGIKTSFADQKLTISVYGNPILEEGVTLSMSSTKVKDLDPPAPVYEEDPFMELNVEQEVKAATPGSRWATNLVKKKDGVVVEESFLHNSTYKGKSATIKRNTSGTVMSSEGTGSSSAESGAENGPSGNQNLPSVEPLPNTPTEQRPTSEEPTTAHSGSYPGGPGAVTEPTSGMGGGPGSYDSPAGPGGYDSPAGPGGYESPAGPGSAGQDANPANGGMFSTAGP